MRTANGFTLIEVLVVLVIGGLLLTSLSWVTRSLSLEVRSAKRGLSLDRLEAVQKVLTELIEGAQPTAGVKGDSSRLTAVVDGPDAIKADGPYDLNVLARQSASGEDLVLSFKPRTSEKIYAPSTVEVVALSGLKRIDFTYTPKSEERLAATPAFVTVRLVDQSDATYELIAAPRVTSAGGCRFDPISLTCR